MNIQEHFDQVESLFHAFDVQRSQIESMDNHFHDMAYNPTKYHWIICPVSLHSLWLLRLANEKYFAQLIYNELESLYKSILLDFDPTASLVDFFNIRPSKIINKIINNASEWAHIKTNPNHSRLITTLINSSAFNTWTSPEYSIINSFIEWRWANAHFSLWSRSIDLTYFKGQFYLYKQPLINLHDKFLRYMKALKSSSFNTDFDIFP